MTPDTLSPRLNAAKPMHYMQLIKRMFLCLFAASLLTACGTQRTYGEASGIEVTDLAALPAPTQSYFHVIGPQEILNITVTNSELLSGPFLTDGAGRIDYPLIGTLELAGETPTAAARLIASRLQGRVVKNPQVNVIPEVIETLTFSVGGQVDKPGTYDVDDNLSLMRAVNIAGGQTQYSDLEEVLVFREVAGKSYIGVYNLKAIRSGNVADPRLYPNDVVMVGDSAAKRRLETILDIVPTILSAAILVERVGRAN